MGSRELQVLKGVTLSIAAGEFVAFMGPSGSGKSTLLHILGALDRPTAGKVVIAGHDISQMDDVELAALRNQFIGFVFQNFHLLNYYSALENVNLPLLYAGTHRQEASSGLRLLENVGLADRAHHRPNELSGGERQRVAIARALINHPSILCADEPTGNLDSHNGAIVMGFLEQINREGTTIVLITHDPLIAEHAGRIIHIQDGSIQ